ncbi:MAG: NB-ARC domain-containing protein, partial [Candidatus Rickettsiella isopodorum]|nr:NB-ARC domain-containing protein [Candidatus Rickettsiella isopodorum]
MLQIENKTQQFYRYSKLIQLQEIEHSIKQRISSRIKRAPSVNTLVEATAKNDFSYWLSQEDIADIARIEYNQFRTRTENNAEFEILGSMTQLSSTVKSFQEKIKTNKWSKALLTLIMNLENLHWVTMLISYKNNNYVAYYVDSKNNPIPQNYFELLYNPYLIHPIINLNSGYMQQKDGFNCGLWALENAVVLNAMFDHKEPLDWLSKALRRVHDKNYFEGKRILLSEKLINDPLWKERHLNFVHPDEISKKTQLLDDSFTLDKLEHDSKRLKASPNKEKEKVTALLEIFVTTFLSFFLKNIGIYHVLAKEKRLTAEALKVEIKTGATSALFGVYIADSLVGLIPALVASLRTISSKYYISKDKAQKITHFFSNVESGNLDSMLAEVAVNIFYSFESQFMQVTDKAGEKVAIEKLAEDAVERIFNAINKLYDVNCVFSKQLLEESVLKGASEKFFDPNLKEIALTTSGYMILNKEGEKINTSKLYEHTGLVELSANDQPIKFYATKKYSRHKYGYRRLFDWEKEVSGELKKDLKEQYINDQFLQANDISQFHLRKYSYVFSQETNHAEASRLLDKIKNHQFPQPVIKDQNNKKPIYFNLRKPVKNFSGRIEILKNLHRTLISERTIAIVPNWSTFSISSDKDIADTHGSDSSSASSGSLLSISGLGGIGKTQLALRYAELYAHHYDHNVLWIDAETIENIAYSFKKLSKKLEISISEYGQEKTLEEIVENAYEYFSDRKSLFIFDNVENYRAIEIYLPKSRPDNKPTVLITSRYGNWDNVATTMKLNVFTEVETQELIKKSLGLDESTQLEKILELNQLLQGLPLALQQALAYIKLRRSTDSIFSFQDYIELYKEKKKELLNFDFTKYFNDPYLETVFTTWLITLCKIKSNPIGEDAIEILNIMAYLNPNSISINKFEYLNKIYFPKSYDLASITSLLNSYSMINSHGKEDVYTIHRLVQQVIRINLEEHQEKFKAIVEKAQLLFWHWQFAFKKDQEVFFHYLHFLIYMAEHKELIGSLLFGHPEKILFDNLILKNEKQRHYFIDLAYLKFPKEKFLKFAGDAIAYYIKFGLFFSLSEILNYLEKKWSIKSFSKENINYISEYINNLKNSKLKLNRFSSNPEKKARQRSAVLLYAEFNHKIFGNFFFKYAGCSFQSLKRSICLLSEAEKKIKEHRNQAIKAHFKKIEQVSRFISSALMTKDTLSALIQGHFNEVAINFGLMTSSLFFGKISDSLLTQGKNLASDASLLEKNLGLENKKVLSILFNENVSSMGKRQFLGKALQAASPFVAKATSIYFAYNLKNEIHAYRMGNKDVLPNIISNSVILSIDGIEAGIEGAEFLGFITGISAFTGPLGEGMALVVWLGAEGYAAEKHVEAIEKYVHLSRGEKFFEFLLSTLHLAPLEYIQLKANNGQLVERAINFLKDNTAIQWYIFPAFTFVEDTCKIRKAFLTEKINFTPDDNNPDEPAEGNLICLSASPPPYEVLNIKMKYYLCHKTLGVSYALNRTGNGTLVDLGEGEDEVIAFFSHSPTLFIVQNGKKRYLGGDNGNVFNLQGNSIAGLLQGGNETDILVLDKFHPENSDYLLFDTDGFLCGKNKAAMQSIPPFCAPDEIRVQIDRIDHIYGRKNESDILYLDQDVRFIDGYGGKNQTHPDNFFITDRSYKNLEFVLRNNTLITF